LRSIGTLLGTQPGLKSIPVKQLHLAPGVLLLTAAAGELLLA